jgi:hypothetical protein
MERVRCPTVVTAVRSATVRTEITPTAFWDVTPRSLVGRRRSFGGTCRLHLLGRRIRPREEKPVI